MEPNWSEKVFKVIKVQGQTVFLDDGTKFKDFYQFTFNYAKNPGN